jgi:hypothetical protein
MGKQHDLDSNQDVAVLEKIASTQAPKKVSDERLGVEGCTWA